MRQRLLSTRAVVTRTSRSDARGAVLESVAAEFALLAQRRARMTRQIDLLQRQINAAAAGLNGVMARMTVLAQRIDAIDPGLRGRLAMPEPPPPPRPAPPPPPLQHATPAGIPRLASPRAAPGLRPMRLAPVRRPYPAS